MSAPLRPSGHSSVMAGRIEPPDSLDYFPTPPWAARAGGEVIAALDPAAISCWEPACGEGHMAHGLGEYFAQIGASDIHPYGFGAEFDFLSDRDWPSDTPWPARPHWDWIVSNPPFIHGETFVRHGLKRAKRGVAMLLRLVFLEGGKRARMFTEHPPAVVAPFCERVPMVKGRWDPDASSATAYAWFIWLQPCVPRPPDLGPGTQLRWILPGAKARLHRRADVERFGAKAQTPLFGEDGEGSCET